MGWGKRKTKRASVIKGIDLRMDDEMQADLEFAGAEEQEAEPERTEPVAHRPEPAEEAAEPTFLGEDVRVRGELSGTEDVRVEGRFEGKVDMPDRVFHVGPAGRVAAEVHAREVVIEGELVGNVRASERVEITATGRLIGDVHAPRVVLAEGGRLTGAVDMGPAHDEPADEAEARHAGVSAQSAIAQSTGETAKPQAAADAKGHKTPAAKRDPAPPQTAKRDDVGAAAKQPKFGPPAPSEPKKAEGAAGSPNAALAALFDD